jgi:hypothetical protein
VFRKSSSQDFRKILFPDFRRTVIRVILLTVSVTCLLTNACHPERTYIEEPEARLKFTTDTVFFDTVFTTIGTITESFRIKNPHNRFIRIDEIRLAGGSASVFRINVDGVPGIEFNNLEIAPRDSMYVFVEATLDRNNANDILRIQDSIVFLTNGNTQDVDLVAWGQDVHILRDTVLEGSVTWTADKPYLILDYVYVDSMAGLTIDPGVTVHLHRDALLFVEGTLQVNGTLEEPVRFLGDRLEEFYKEFPGQWGLIYLSALSRNNRINYAEIQNGTIGVLISAPPESGLQPDLEISNTIINRMSSSGIYALNARVTGTNLVIGECGGFSLGLIHSGFYDFTHCTFNNVWSGETNRRLPAVYLADYFVNRNEDGELEITPDGVFEQARFRNSVIYGNARTELVIESFGNKKLNYRFDHCLVKIDEDSLDYESDPLFTNILANQDPKLLPDTIPYPFIPDSASAVIDAGRPATGAEIPFDLKGINRLLDAAPDLGAYEWVPGESGEEN